MGKKQSSVQRYEKKSNYSPIWKKILLERTHFEVLVRSSFRQSCTKHSWLFWISIIVSKSKMTKWPWPNDRVEAWLVDKQRVCLVVRTRYLNRVCGFVLRVNVHLQRVRLALKKCGQSGHGQNGHFRFRKHGHLLTIYININIYIIVVVLTASVSCQFWRIVYE